MHKKVDLKKKTKKSTKTAKTFDATFCKNQNLTKTENDKN